MCRKVQQGGTAAEVPPPYFQQKSNTYYYLPNRLKLILYYLLVPPLALRRYYSLFTLAMLVMFECTVVGQRQRNLHDVRALQQPKAALQVGGRWAVGARHVLLSSARVEEGGVRGGQGGEG